MTRNLPIALVLIVAIATSYLLIGKRNEQTRPAATPSESGYYLRDATIQGVDEQGLHVYTLQAERVVQQPGVESVILETVALKYALPDSEPWELFAENGVIPAEGKRIALSGNVTLKEQLMRGDPLTTIRTPQLDIDLQAHTANTDMPVDIVRDNYRLKATGMLADFREQTLTLKNEVNGHFLP